MGGMSFDLRSQMARTRSALLLVYGLAVLLVAAVGIIGSTTKATIADLMRDPVQSLGAPFYMGFASNVGILFWCATAAVCFFASAVLRRSEGRSEWSCFFTFAGVLTAILLVDDFFLVHDEIVPNYLFPRKGWLHLNEKVVLAVYALVAMRFFWSCRRTILKKTDWLLLAVAMGFLALSVIAERSFTKAFIPTKELRTLAEDGFKLMGIMGWFHYFARTALAVVTGKPQSRA